MKVAYRAARSQVVQARGGFISCLELPLLIVVAEVMVEQSSRILLEGSRGGTFDGL
jgi:hypothetical protein